MDYMKYLEEHCVEVFFPADNFLTIKETLARTGKKLPGKNVEQQCYIYHKRGTYYVLHYKQLEIIDGEDSVFTPEEQIITNLIISVLYNWDLIGLQDDEDKKILVPPSYKLKGQIKVVPSKEKSRWNFISPYNIGVKK